MDRLVIEISGDLPDEGKFATLAKAESLAHDLALQFAATHPSLKLAVTVKSVRPSKKAATPAAVVQRRAAE